MSEGLLMAVDGGNSKTDLLLARTDGTLLAFVRGPGCSPHNIGVEASVGLIGDLLEIAQEQASLGAARCGVAVLLIAGADLHGEEDELRRLAEQRGWADLLEVGNDTLALLRAGSHSGIGVSVVCGAGINALAVAPDGREARFSALGPITGDWGGGADLGLAALGEAVRAGDGRGRPTELSRLIPDHFGLPTAEDVAFALHRGEIDYGRLVELAPVVLRAASAGDTTAAGLRDRLEIEIVTFVRAAAGRVLSGLQGYAIVLGGSVLAGDEALAQQVIERLHRELPDAVPQVCVEPPVLGSALIGLELLGASDAAARRLEASLRQSAPTPATGRPIIGRVRR